MNKQFSNISIFEERQIDVEYSINKLSKLAGISTRTLRYYDEIGLISPKRISSNGYRVYGQKEVDLLQRILFFRELEMPLDEIKRIMQSKDFDDTVALQEHLAALKSKRNQIDLLITNVEKTISASKGEITMSDKEKFEGFKRNLIDENEKKYGKEIREKFGDDTINNSNTKIMGLSAEQYEKAQNLSSQINSMLKMAFEQGNPSGELAQKTCALHKEWLSYHWEHYSKEAHLGLTQMYVEDPRFRQYYDDIAVGCADFLHEAMQIYCEKD